jgi:hypothetical protein
MSIYPVKLSEWFPMGDEYHQTAISCLSYMRCKACGRKVTRWKKAIGHHSLPWGYGDLWCSKKCLLSGKTARPDKRRERRFKRKIGKIKLDEFFKVNI